jgi:CheY-like chemotaxis protein
MDLRILVVDDSQATRRVVSALLGSRWTVCGVAENGKAAVTKFRQLKPDLVLLDLGMADIDGLEVGRRISAIDPTSRSFCLHFQTPGAWKALPEKRVFAKSFRKSKVGNCWTASNR